MSGNLRIRTLLQVLRFPDPSKGIEPLNQAWGPFSSKKLAGVAVYARLVLYLLKFPAIE